MIVYHASRVMVEHPDVVHSRRYLDFGQGFYVTPIKLQAVNYAQRFLLWDDVAYLNCYEMDISNAIALRIKNFDDYDGEWLDYISACRLGLPVESFDVVEGGIADDRVYNTVDLYFANQISREEALRRLKAVRPNRQICFLTQNAIDRCLKFLNVEMLKN